MITVLHVMSRMAPAGTELQLAGMLRAAQNRHWQPTLCVLYPGFPLAEEIRRSGVAVVELDGRSRVHLDRFRALRRLTRTGHFDVVHTSLWGAGAFGRTSLIGPHRPAVVMSERRVEEFRSPGRRLMDAALAQVTDEWIGNSADVCEFIRRAHRAPAARIHLVRNGVDTAVFHPARERRVVDGPARIGALGRLIHQKGFDVLLAALPAVLAERDVEVVIVGEGELRADLERRAADLPVRLPGALPGGPAVAAYLQGIDLFVMPSRYEGLPNAVLEALACGVPVVATDVAGMREAVGPDVDLVRAEDPAALARAMLTALAHRHPTDPGIPRSFDDVAVDHLRVFESALERRRRTPELGRTCA
ncbi:MAG TPA: glycosyltransferase [Jatrophihabitans sp.]|nr:glycosyltransferase [Jatrophihabitans sp.]